MKKERKITCHVNPLIIGLAPQELTLCSWEVFQLCLLLKDVCKVSFSSLVKNPLHQDRYQEEFISISSSLILSQFHPSMDKDEITWYLPNNNLKVGLST